MAALHGLMTMGVTGCMSTKGQSRSTVPVRPFQVRRFAPFTHRHSVPLRKLRVRQEEEPVVSKRCVSTCALEQFSERALDSMAFAQRAALDLSYREVRCFVLRGLRAVLGLRHAIAVRGG